MVDRPPLRLPTGVRTASTITVSRMCAPISIQPFDSRRRFWPLRQRLGAAPTPGFPSQINRHVVSLFHCSAIGGMSLGLIRGAQMRRVHSLVGVTIAGAGTDRDAPGGITDTRRSGPSVRLISGDTADSPLGDGTALIMGGSGLPTPGQPYAWMPSSRTTLAPRDLFRHDADRDHTRGALSVFGSLRRDVRRFGGPGTTDSGRCEHFEPDRRRKCGRREPCRGLRLVAERGDLVAIAAGTREPKCAQRRCALCTGR